MDYFGVDTWDDVLAFFQEGGDLEDQWGWLEVLRQADFGTTVYFMRTELVPLGRFQCGTEPCPIGKRIFQECDGGICPISNLLVREAASFKLFGPGYDRARHNGTRLIADRWYPHSRIDWDKADRTEALVDVGGIVGEVGLLSRTPLGFLIYAGSQMGEMWNWGRKVHFEDNEDIFDLAVDVGNSLLEAEKLVPQVGAYGNLFSLARNLGSGWEITP